MSFRKRIAEASLQAYCDARKLPYEPPSDDSETQTTTAVCDVAKSSLNSVQEIVSAIQDAAKSTSSDTTGGSPSTSDASAAPKKAMSMIAAIAIGAAGLVGGYLWSSHNNAAAPSATVVEDSAGATPSVETKTDASDAPSEGEQGSDDVSLLQRLEDQGYHTWSEDDE